MGKSLKFKNTLETELVEPKPRKRNKNYSYKKNELSVNRKTG